METSFPPEASLWFLPSTVSSQDTVHWAGRVGPEFRGAWSRGNRLAGGSDTTLLLPEELGAKTNPKCFWHCFPAKIHCSSHHPGCTLWSEAENWASRGPVPTAATSAFVEWPLPPAPCFCACSKLLLDRKSVV